MPKILFVNAETIRELREALDGLAEAAGSEDVRLATQSDDTLEEGGLGIELVYADADGKKVGNALDGFVPTPGVHFPVIRFR